MSPDMFTGEGQVAILFATLTSLVLTLAKMYYDYKREGRRQDWEKERREWEAGAAERHAKVAKEAKEERDLIAKRVAEAEISLNAKIDENTEISKQAFDIGNNYNAKIKAQGESFDQMLKALFHSDVEREARLAAAAISAADKVATVTAETAATLASLTSANAAGLATKVAESASALESVAEDTSDTRQKVNQIRDKVVGDGE